MIVMELIPDHPELWTYGQDIADNFIQGNYSHGIHNMLVYGISPHNLFEYLETAPELTDMEYFNPAFICTICYDYDKQYRLLNAK